MLRSKGIRQRARRMFEYAAPGKGPPDTQKERVEAREESEEAHAMGNSGGGMEQAELQQGHVRPFKRRAPLQLCERLSFFSNGRNGGERKE